MMKLQRDIGNQAVQRLLLAKRIQTKLTIGAPNDKYEQEADRVADQVMRMTDSDVTAQRQLTQQSTPLAVQRLCPECEKELQRQPLDEEEEEEEELLQAKEMPGQSPGVSQEVESAINSLHGGGQALAKSERDFMEPRFGYDFSKVRVHTDNQASGLAHSINARAFTLDNNIVFGSGEYDAGTNKGQHLLAHELTHVIQQGNARIRTGRKKVDGDQLVKTKLMLKKIQRECRHFDAGWTHPSTGRPGPAGTWCDRLAEAQARSMGCPRDCFVYSDGPASHPYREIPPNLPCAHYVAHELNIRVGSRHARCSEGYSVSIGQITSGKNSHNLNQAQVDDIWISVGGGHSGVVRAVDSARGRVRIQACSVGGAVYSSWENSGTVYR